MLIVHSYVIHSYYGSDSGSPLIHQLLTAEYAAAYQLMARWNYGRKLGKLDVQPLEHIEESCVFSSFLSHVWPFAQKSVTTSVLGCMVGQ